MVSVLYLVFEVQSSGPPIDVPWVMDQTRVVAHEHPLPFPPSHPLVTLGKKHHPPSVSKPGLAHIQMNEFVELCHKPKR